MRSVPPDPPPPTLDAALAQIAIEEQRDKTAQGAIAVHATRELTGALASLGEQISANTDAANRLARVTLALTVVFGIATFIGTVAGVIALLPK